MPEYSQDYSRRKLKAVDAINKEVDKINAIKASGGKVRGNEPKMTLEKAMKMNPDFMDLCGEKNSNSM